MIKRLLKIFAVFFLPFIPVNHNRSFEIHLKFMNLLSNKGFVAFASLVEQRIYYRFNCLISSKAKIGKNVNFMHPIGNVIGTGVVIGDDCKIWQNVTIGAKSFDELKYPCIGNNVTIYANAVVIGDIFVGDNVIIGAGAIVAKNCSANSVVVGNPAKIAKQM
jgi:serine O-acetyltransferase